MTTNKAPAVAEARALLQARQREAAADPAGFGSGALAERLRLSGARVLFTTDVTYRKGRDIPLKGIVDEAVATAGAGVERVVVLRRTDADVPMQAGRDVWWDDFLARGAGQ